MNSIQYHIEGRRSELSGRMGRGEPQLLSQIVEKDTEMEGLSVDWTELSWRKIFSMDDGAVVVMN